MPWCFNQMPSTWRRKAVRLFWVLSLFERTSWWHFRSPLSARILCLAIEVFFFVWRRSSDSLLMFRVKMFWVHSPELLLESSSIWIKEDHHTVCEKIVKFEADLIIEKENTWNFHSGEYFNNFIVHHSRKILCSLSSEFVSMMMMIVSMLQLHSMLCVHHRLDCSYLFY